jgi:hypothetical protein
MSRQQKKGIDYFPFDVDFFSDRKIKELRGKYGADGLTLYLYLLCQIYKDEGYYLQLDDGYDYVISADLGMESEKIGQILNFLCRRSLFDDKLFTSDKVLTSHGIQMRFQECVKTRAQKKEIAVNKSFWILKNEETKSYIKVTHFSDNSEIKGHLSEKKEHLSMEKCHKVKESKVKESKVKYISMLPQIVEAWNGLAAYGVPKILSLSDKRKKALEKLLDEHGVENVFKAINSIPESDFLLGKTGNWKIDFDFFLRPDKFLKIVEGGYCGTCSKNEQVGKGNYDKRQYDDALLDSFVNRGIDE